MYIKIYFDGKPVFLSNEINSELKEILRHPDSVFIDEVSTKAINSLLHEIKRDNFHAGVLFHPDLALLKKSFFRHFTFIEAAGGLVQNGKNEILFIFRSVKWDLPKGKMEKNEKPEECAIREVEEETGVKGLLLKEKLGETYHTYNAYGKHFLKINHWFLMSCRGKQNEVPQIEEDITAIKWVHPSDLSMVLSNTYPSIKDILNQFLNN